MCTKLHFLTAHSTSNSYKWQSGLKTLFWYTTDIYCTKLLLLVYSDLTFRRPLTSSKKLPASVIMLATSGCHWWDTISCDVASCYHHSSHLLCLITLSQLIVSHPWQTIHGQRVVSAQTQVARVMIAWGHITADSVSSLTDDTRPAWCGLMLSSL